MSRFFIVIGVVAALATPSGLRAEDTPPAYEPNVRALLLKRCGHCHGETVRKGGLNLSSIAGIRAGGESGEQLVGPSLDDSLLWSMIDDGAMPPDGEESLTNGERELIRRWILSKPEDAVLADEVPDQHDVIPIMLLRCVVCHGPRRQDARLDLRTPAAMKEGGVSGPGFLVGDADGSRIIQRIESEECPPRDQLLRVFVRRPPRSEVRVIRQWIAAGAPISKERPDEATDAPDPLVSDEDRRHWAFQPPKITFHRASIDEYLSDKLVEANLTFAPRADRDTLIRRAYFDLWGLPPSTADWKKWRSLEQDGWYEAMIDHLLQSPHYGERWGRYWLDNAGYADSEGGVSADPLRDVAWKYRDYVIRALNEDKPYDQFLLEQIAGDELVDYENATEVTSQMVDRLVATGFLRMGIDQTGSRTMNFVPERLGVIDDAMAVLSSTVLGLTLKCARCHSHKYDPIPHRDYYRFKAVFQGAFDEHDWLTFRNRKLSVGTPEHVRRVTEINPAINRSLRALRKQIKATTTERNLAILRHHYPQQSENDRRATTQALGVADNSRTLEQRNLVEMLQQASVRPDSEQPPAVISLRERLDELEDRAARLKTELVPPLAIRALWDRGAPSPTYILHRGEHDKPGRQVGPGLLSVLTDGRTPFQVEEPFPGGTRKTGRRLALAKWLIRTDHPLTARVMVNRLWHHHFGAGLVRSLDNFGIQGDRPSHPELLDWLALRFVESGWSVKAMHRLMMTSRAYRQSSRIDARRRCDDPQNRLLSRMPLRRLDAESLRDALLFVAGRLDTTRGGPPDSVTVDSEGLVRARATDRGDWRRSVYLQFRRTAIPTLLDTFDYPVMGPNCVQRNVSTVSPQALLMLNNGHIFELAGSFARRIRSKAGDDRNSQVNLVYSMALSRLPTDEESEIGRAALAAFVERWRQAGKDNASEAALTTYCHTVMNSAPFAYVD